MDDAVDSIAAKLKADQAQFDRMLDRRVSILSPRIGRHIRHYVTEAQKLGHRAGLLEALTKGREQSIKEAGRG